MKHCFHSTGMSLLTCPPQHPEICCFCSKHRTVRESLKVPKGHGPHVPQEWREKVMIRPFDDEECPERK